MKIKNINYSEKKNKAILSGQLILGSGKIHTVYFEVEKLYKDFISKDASSFMTAALGIAMKKGENLEIDGKISKSLMKNSLNVMERLSSLSGRLQPISITAKSVKPDVVKPQNKGIFFSAGVDSFYTYLKNKKTITHLIFVHGFDINVHNDQLYKKIEKNIIKIADVQHVKLIKVKTNIRETLEQYFDWNFSNNFALTSVALFLRNGLKEIYVSCGVPDEKADHPFKAQLIDPLWSTERLKVVHYGCVSKINKMRFLSDYQVAMENLRVCWLNKNNEYNCSECEKCLRNMLAMYVSDSLEKCVTFNKKINLERIKKLRIRDHNIKYYTYILDALRIKKDRSSVRVTLEEFISKNRNPHFSYRVSEKIRTSIQSLDKRYNRNRFYWFLAKKGFI